MASRAVTGVSWTSVLMMPFTAYLKDWTVCMNTGTLRKSFQYHRKVACKAVRS